MFTVEKIENNMVILEDRTTKTLKSVSITFFSNRVKEKDIVIYDEVSNIYYVDKKQTDAIKRDIRSKFDRLKK